MASALEDDDDDNAITAAAQELDRVLRVASSAIHNDTGGLLLGILEETRAHQVSLAKDLKELVDAQKELVAGQKVSPAPCSVQFRSDSLQMLVEAVGALASAVQAVGLVRAAGVVRAASGGEDEERPTRKRRRGAAPAARRRLPSAAPRGPYVDGVEEDDVTVAAVGEGVEMSGGLGGEGEVNGGREEWGLFRPLFGRGVS